jgi:hypothetical protein
MDAEVGGVEQARAGARRLVQRWLAPGTTLSVRDAKYVALALTAVGDHRYAVEAIKRARPIGVELSTSLRDSALAAIRADTAVARILRSSGGRG